MDELDYEKEVENCELFRSQMNTVGAQTLGDIIVIPQVYKQYSSNRVLTSQWIEGTKLNKMDMSTEQGRMLVKKLTQVLLNCYLVQLLDTGFLHSDPHSGNFLVTANGKLCILDYGLMTSVDEDKRYALLDYVTHLLCKDYASTLNDLITLEFIPASIRGDQEKLDYIVPIVGDLLTKLSRGGGTKALKIDDVSNKLQSLSKEYPIVIPAYFGLILRAFRYLLLIVPLCVSYRMYYFVIIIYERLLSVTSI